MADPLLNSFQTKLNYSSFSNLAHFFEEHVVKVTSFALIQATPKPIKTLSLV